MAANKITKPEEEGDNPASAAIEKHRGVSEQHRNKKMEIGGESKGEVREGDAGGGGIEVLECGAAGEKAADEADGDGGDEAEEKSKDGYGNPDRRRH